MAACAARFHPDVEAAFLHHWGIDTLDPKVTPRRMWVLLQRLPPGAWPDPDSEGSWSIEAYLMAAMVDRLAEFAWMFATVNSKKGSKPKKPKQVPRPGGKHAEPPVKTSGMASLQAAMKEVKR